ncbi:hypothetical protein T492DRAFT_912795 [Pavlovales sp. CCMP2436]|nr:hypothetical protein T492DRAFT_912795 [Pavlovales sp. CCMP2436]
MHMFCAVLNENFSFASFFNIYDLFIERWGSRQWVGDSQGWSSSVWTRQQSGTQAAYLRIFVVVVVVVVVVVGYAHLYTCVLCVCYLQKYNCYLVIITSMGLRVFTGLRVFFFQIHPMRLGNTMMNSLLFNTLLILVWYASC